MFLSTNGILSNSGSSSAPATLPGDYAPGSYVAYSLRKVVSAYSGPVVRIRRVSDNVEQDFTATQLTDGTLLSFIGSSSAFVTTLYNQTSTSGMNLVQTTQANQPIIAETGTIYTENGKPSMKFDGARFLSHATAASWVFLHYYPTSVFSVQRVTGANPDSLYAIWATGQSVTGTRVAYLRYEDRAANGYNNDWIHIVGNSGVCAYNYKTFGTGEFQTDKLLTARVHADPRNSTIADRSYAGVNGNSLVNINIDNKFPSTSNPTHGLRIGDANGGWRLVGAVSELIIYYFSITDQNMRSQDSAIDTEMKNYYGIT